MPTKEKDQEIVVVEELGNYRDAPQQVAVISDPVLNKTQAEVGSEVPDHSDLDEKPDHGGFVGADPGPAPEVDSNAPGAGTAAMPTGPDGSTVGTGQPAALEEEQKARDKAAAKEETAASAAVADDVGTGPYEDRTATQLRAVAKRDNVDLQGARSKEEILKALGK